MSILEHFLCSLEVTAFVLSICVGCMIGAILGLIAGMFVFDWICGAFFYFFK